ncbi:MAG: deoxynucleoside kinase [Burkholderiales bacterium]|nr:deoxynucleoside kinase [Burkholderiales bacterium]
MDTQQLRYVVVEGPIGVGKTSLARRLAGKLGAELLLEAPAENPFLARFYAEPARFALPTQLNFLFQRADQVRALAQLNLFSRTVVADFMLDKDPLFAELNLAEDELSLYRRLYAHLQPQAPRPDLVIALQASTDTLLARVRQRAIRYEQPIAAEYLARLTDAYTRLFHRYDAAPVLFVNTDGLNFVDNAEHLDWLWQHVQKMRGEREFFNVSTSD